ncbi:MAG: hypothetical protein ABI220_03605 [Candidatus Saccharimonadales bacterium]
MYPLVGRAISADIPDRGPTTLYPLRESNFGSILPHIYAERMRRQDGQNRDGAFTQVNLCINRLYEMNGSVDGDYSTEHFQSLLRDLRVSPYSEQPELTAKLEEVFTGYKDIREAQRIKAARKLSQTIGRAELYIVAADSADWRTPRKGNLYAARLSRIVNVRSGNRMNYGIVARDFEGNEGFLPQTFHVPGGASARAA